MAYIYSYFFFFNDTATTEIYTLSLHDALPISFLDAHGEALPEGGGSLAQLADLGGGWGLGAQVLALGDVTTPLIGSDGAAPVFAPQKGAGPEGVKLLSRGLERLAELMARHGRPELATLPGGGADRESTRLNSSHRPI